VKVVPSEASPPASGPERGLSGACSGQAMGGARLRPMSLQRKPPHDDHPSLPKRPGSLLVLRRSSNTTLSRFLRAVKLKASRPDLAKSLAESPHFPMPGEPTNQ
jgi:hypothetical protein